MRCKRCGRVNPANSKRCMYCNTPFYRNNPSSKKTGHRNNSDTPILAAIIALVLVLAILLGVYGYQNFMPKKNRFTSGGGGGGVITSTANQPSAPNNDINVTLEGDDPDVEIYYFDTDTYDIPVGTVKTVKFTAEIFANIELSDTDVSVVDNAGAVTGYMNDKGIDGDAVANDGIYTLVTELSSDVRKEMTFRAKAKNSTGNPIEIFFYTQITAEDYAACTNVLERLRELNDYNAIYQYLLSESAIDSSLVSPDKRFIKYTFKSGITGIWENAPEETGERQAKSYSGAYPDMQLYLDYAPIRNQVSQRVLSGVYNDGDVSVIRPYRSTDFDYDDFLDAGKILAGVLGGSVKKFDNNKANLERFKEFDDYGVTLIDSHGTLSGDNPYILTGDSFLTRNQVENSADWQDERIIVCSGGFFEQVLGGGSIAVGAEFFDRYYADHSLDGTAFFLGSCYSMYNNTIADTLVSKGAEIVYGFSDVVYVSYCNNMLQELMLNQLVLNTTTAQNGYTNSRQTHGSVDPDNARCELRKRGDDSFRLVTDKQHGKIAGTVKDASTGAMIRDALIRIYSDGDLVESARTNNSGYYTINVPAGEYVIKVSYGQYKTAKVAATVTENITTYVETLLMLDAGLTTGFANGVITNAITGEGVSDVSIRLRKSWNNRTGAVVRTTTTNNEGYYEFSYHPGFYTIEYSKNGYITGYKNIIIGIADFEAQNAAISPEMPDDGEFRIVLSWSNIPNDLDSHLTGPTIDGDRFHLYYEYADTTSRNTNSDYYKLDLDNTNIVQRPNIPETTTIVTQLDGVYRYSVHDYTNRGRANSDALAQSNATVNVYKGAALVATYHVPPNVTGTIWTVFELSGDEIKPINKMGNGMANDISKF